MNYVGIMIILKKTRPVIGITYRPGQPVPITVSFVLILDLRFRQLIVERFNDAEIEL